MDEQKQEAITAASNLGVKLLELVENAAGGIFKPRQIKRIAKASKKAIELLGQANDEVPGLNFEFKTDSLTVNNQVAEVSERALKRLVSQEIERQLNIEKVVDMAYQRLKDQIPENDEKVDKDWILRFFKAVEDVSDTSLQQLWSKLLAGEVKRPQTYSFRTLSLLASLTTRDIKFLQESARYIIIDGEFMFLCRENDILEKHNFDYQKVFYMQELGLLTYAGDVNFYKSVKEDGRVILENAKYRLYSTSNELQINMAVYAVTQLGKQIFSLFEIKQNNQYFIDVCAYLISVHPELKLERLPIEAGGGEKKEVV